MIANFFRKTKPINFLTLSVLLFIVYVVSLIFVNSEEISFNFLIKKGIYLLLLVFMFFIFDFVIRKNALTNDNSFALWFYVLLFGFFPYSLDKTEILIANFFLLLSFRKIYSLRTPLKTKEKIFDSALWIGVSSMFYDWSFVYLVLLYIAIFLFDKGSRRNIFIPIIGFSTPIFLLYVYTLIADNINGISSYWQLGNSFNFANYSNRNHLFPFVFISIFALVSFFLTTKKTFLSKPDFKSTWLLLMFQIVLSVIIVIMAPIKDGSELSFLFFPLSILYANFVQDIERYWLKEVILYLFVFVYLSAYIF